MNMELRQPLRTQRVKPAIVDCDVHPNASYEDLRPFLSNRWWDHLQTIGERRRHGFAKTYPYPKITPRAARRDSWPPDGGLPGSNLDFLREQHLDHYGIEYGMLTPLQSTGQGDQNPDFGAALATANNEWQLEAMARKEPRLKASIVVPNEDGEAARKEVHRRAGTPEFAQVFLLSRTAEALGRRRYWPIYEAAVEHGLPVGIHVFGYGGWSLTNTGWPSFYIEEMTEHATSMQALVTSFIMEGVFERLPELKVVLIESGFGWLPALGWRLDKHWKKLKSEVPSLKMAPSEYIKKHFWVSTQPMEETDDPEHLLDVMKWIGYDRILFASDYPHWDFDDPFLALPPSLDETQRQQIFSGNAKAVYRLP
jgi:predicted TIM-barrel fold metal-dependent hydrolase